MSADPECRGGGAEGARPSAPPFEVEQFDRMRESNIDTIVDSAKYYSSSGAIVLGLFAGWSKDAITASSPLQHEILVGVAIVSWLVVVAGGVFTVYPLRYDADTDAEKSEAVEKIMTRKRRGALLTLWFFLGSALLSGGAFLWIR